MLVILYTNSEGRPERIIPQLVRKRSPNEPDKAYYLRLWHIIMRVAPELLVESDPEPEPVEHGKEPAGLGEPGELMPDPEFEPIPEPKVRLKLRLDETTPIDLDEIERLQITYLMARFVPADATHVRVVDNAELPYGGPFRGLWARQGDALPTVDIEAARKLKTDEVRIYRDRKLVSLDGKELQAMGNGIDAQLADIRARKQALRDLPETIQPELALIDDLAELANWKATFPDDA